MTSGATHDEAPMLSAGCPNLHSNADRERCTLLNMDAELWSYSEAGRRAGISERTVRRWVEGGLLRRYWWPVGSRRQGPRVSSADLAGLTRTTVLSETYHGLYEFHLNRPRRGLIEIFGGDGAKVGNAGVYLDAAIDWAKPHPDGLVVGSGGNVGKVTKNDKGAWCFSLADGRDLELSGLSHAGDSASSAAAPAQVDDGAPPVPTKPS